MSDDRDYKGFENDDNEYTKDGNYFNENFRQFSKRTFCCNTSPDSTSQRSDQS